MKPAGESREALRSASAEYLLENGLADLSLRPIAAAIGTSARMLVYHFGSKDRLIAEAMAEIRERQRAIAEDWIARHEGASPEEFLRFVWSWITAPGRERYLRLFFEAVGRGDREPFAEFSRAAFDDWVEWAQRRFAAAGRPAADSRARAVLTVSAIRGLALYYLATGDRSGARAALGKLAQLSSSRGGAR
jgi:AcrR family transcriptional regulator